jgi:hypothetical protein
VKTHLLKVKGLGGDKTHLLDNPLWELWGRFEDPGDPLHINRRDGGNLTEEEQKVQVSTEVAAANLE